MESRAGRSQEFFGDFQVEQIRDSRFSLADTRVHQAIDRSMRVKLVRASKLFRPVDTRRTSRSLSSTHERELPCNVICARAAKGRIKGIIPVARHRGLVTVTDFPQTRKSRGVKGSHCFSRSSPSQSLSLSLSLSSSRASSCSRWKPTTTGSVVADSVGGLLIKWPTLPSFAHFRRHSRTTLAILLAVRLFVRCVAGDGAFCRANESNWIIK